MGDILKDRVAVITGAGGGIGSAEAVAMAAQGAKVVVNDTGVAHTKDNPHESADQTVETIKQAGGEAVGHSLDGEPAPARVGGQGSAVGSAHLVGALAGDDAHGGEVGLSAPGGGPQVRGRLVGRLSTWRVLGGPGLEVPVEDRDEGGAVPEDEALEVGRGDTGRQVAPDVVRHAVEDGLGAGRHVLSGGWFPAGKVTTGDRGF